jgi:hypothetical protein
MGQSTNLLTDPCPVDFESNRVATKLGLTRKDREGRNDASQDPRFRAGVRPQGLRKALARSRGFGGYVNRKWFKINLSA